MSILDEIVIKATNGMFLRVNVHTLQLEAKGEDSISKENIFRMEKTEWIKMCDEFYTRKYLNNNELNPMFRRTEMLKDEVKYEVELDRQGI